MLRKGPVYIFFCILLVSVTFKPLMAQDISKKNDRDIIIKAGITLNKINVKDESFTAIPYSGWKPGFLFSLIIRKQTALQELSINCNSGKLSMESFPGQALQHLFVDVDYARLYKINGSETAPFQWLAGGNLDLVYTRRDYKQFVNRNNSFEFAVSLGLVSEVAYDFQNGIFSNIAIKDRISIPLISLLNQPAFGSEQPEGNLNGEGYTVGAFLKSSSIASFSSYLRIKNSLAIEKSISETQLLSFQYWWDYYQVSGNNSVKQAIHSLGITYQITF